MKYVIATTVAASVLALSGAALAACDTGESIIRFSHVVSASGHPKGEAATLVADRVNAEMNGRFCVEVFPGSQLYDDDKVLEALLSGDVELAAPSLSKFEEFTLQYRVFDLPFLFEDIDAVDRFQQSEIGQQLLDTLQEQGFQGLAFWHNGMKQMSANVPLVDPADAEGLTFRIQASDVLQAQFEALGSSPRMMAFSEVYGALQTGMVDGQENTWSNIYTERFYEVQDGITETNHGIVDYMLVTSLEFWESLDETDRNDLARILGEVTDERNAIATRINMDNRRQIEAEGVEIRTLTSEQRERWVEAMQPVWDKFSEDIGADIIEAALSANMM